MFVTGRNVSIDTMLNFERDGCGDVIYQQSLKLTLKSRNVVRHRNALVKDVLTVTIYRSFDNFVINTTFHSALLFSQCDKLGKMDG